MTLEKVFKSLGVDANTLTAEEKKSLDELGYVILHDLLPAEDIGKIASLIDKCKALKDGYGNLLNHDPVFEQCVTNPRLLACAIHVLGLEIKYGVLNCNKVMPGKDRQALHIDSKKGTSPGNWTVINSVWFIDEFTKENGATRLVPKTHLIGNHANNILEDAKADHPDQIQAVGPAGSAVVFNAYTWHSAMSNTTNAPRVHCIRLLTGGIGNSSWINGKP